MEKRGVTAKLVTLPGGASQVVVAWTRPFDPSPDTSVKEKREVVENLAVAVLNRRLARLARSAAPPFISAQASFQNLFHSGKVAVVQATAAPGAWRPALAATDQEIRRLLADGVTPAELAREETTWRATLVNAEQGSATRVSPTVAQQLVETVDDDEVFTAPSEDLAVFDAAVKDLSPARVDAAARDIFSGAGPLVELVSPEPVEGGEGAVLTAFTDASKTPLAHRAVVADVAWPYANLGPPGRVVERGGAPDLGVVTARFANGVTLTVKPTKLRDDQVLIEARVGRGRLDLPRDRPSPGWATGAVVAGGYGKISFEDAQAALAGRVQSANLKIDDTAFSLTGATRPSDLDTQLQVLAAYLADPGFRTEAFERLRTAYLAELPQLDATPEGVLARESGAILAGGDPRFAFPTREALTTTTAAQWRDLLKGPLTRGPVEVTIVGDVSADQAIAAMARTFGALPERPAARAETASISLAKPSATPVRFTDAGRPDQAIGVVAWPESDFYADMRRSRADMLAGEVFQNRLLDRVRISEGATYSPEMQVELSQYFSGYGYALAQVEMPPQKLPSFFAAAADIARDMASKGITDDELTRARAPRVAGLAKAQRTNEYWLGDLSGSIADPRRLALIRTTFPDYAAVTPADIQASAARWMRDDKSLKVVISAKPSSPDEAKAAETLSR